MKGEQKVELRDTQCTIDKAKSTTTIHFNLNYSGDLHTITKQKARVLNYGNLKENHNMPLELHPTDTIKSNGVIVIPLKSQYLEILYGGIVAHVYTIPTSSLDLLQSLESPTSSKCNTVLYRTLTDWISVTRAITLT